jgi:hypothetical protein
MKAQKLAILIAFILVFMACSNNESNSACEECTYTVASSETAGTVPTSLQGTYDVVLDFATPSSPFPVGTQATFTVEATVLTVEIEGQECITLRNPIETGTSEWTFVDNCRDNYIYGVSQTQTGELNEINLGTTSFEFLGQFK